MANRPNTGQLESAITELLQALLEGLQINADIVQSGKMPSHPGKALAHAPAVQAAVRRLAISIAGAGKTG